MNARLTTLVGGLALATGLPLLAPASTAPVQDPSQDAASVPLASALAREGDALAEDAAAWRLALTDPDLDRRERELDRLLAEVRRHPPLRGLFEEWSHDATAPELAWTARLALRELDRDGRDLTWGHGLGWRSDPLDAAPRLAPGDARPYGQLLGGSWEDVQGELERLRRMFDELPGGVASASRGFELRSGPDGVKATVREDVDGVEQVREYEAATLDELLEAHPELREHVDGTAAVPGLAWGERFPALDRLMLDPPAALRVVPRAPLAPGAPAAPRELRTDVLGVYLRPLEAGEAAALGLETGAGLVVVRTEPGTIAWALGVQRGDVLLEVNGLPATGRDAISEALCARPDDGEVRLVLIDGHGQRRARTWRPREEPADGPLRGPAADRRDL